jgi:TonB family protein
MNSFKFHIISFLAILIFLIGALNLKSQSLSKANKKILERDFDKADEILKKYRKKNPLSCCIFYFQTLYYYEKNQISEVTNSSKIDDILDAYYCLDSTNLFRSSIDCDKEIDDIKFTEEKNYDKDPFFYRVAFEKEYNLLKNKIDEYLLLALMLNNSEDSLNKYINRLFNFRDIGQVIERRDQLAFDFARKLNTEDSYKNFQSKYPNSKLYKKAQELKVKSSFEFAINNLSEKSLNYFITNFSEEYSLVNLCKHKKDSLLFDNAKKEMTLKSFTSFIEKYPNSTYLSISKYYVDSLKSFGLINNGSKEEIEGYLNGQNTFFYDNLYCALKRKFFNDVENNYSITNISRFMSYFQITEDRLCNTNYNFLIDTLYNKTTRLRKACAKIAIQNSTFEQAIFKSSSGKIIKHQMQINDPRLGSQYININVNITPLENLIKTISSISNYDKIVAFGFSNFTNDWDYTSYFPGIFEDNYLLEVNRILTEKISSTEIIAINSLTKINMESVPVYFNELYNFKKNISIQDGPVDCHKINLTFSNGQNLSIIFSKTNFILCHDESMNLNYLIPSKYKIENVESYSETSRRNRVENKQKAEKKIQKIYTENNLTIEEKAPEIFTVVEEMPEFPGGMTELMKYIQNNINYPQVEKEAGIQGKVFLKFVVNPDGSISNTEILRSVAGGEGLSIEALRIVKAMPKWIAGKQNGRNVAVYFNLPINFKLN